MHKYFAVGSSESAAFFLPLTSNKPIMNKVLFENDALSIFHIIGKGVVLSLPKEWRNTDHRIEDEWRLDFGDHSVSGTVTGLERFGYDGLVCGLILRIDLSGEDMSRLKGVGCERLNVYHKI